jgi:lysophospholipid acyltransferase (LPLAT)-like uncharacterized protein
MKLNNHTRNLLRFAGIKTASFLVSAILSTVKIKTKNQEALLKLNQEGKNFVLSFWHGSMVIGWYLHKNLNCSALVSKSKDGDVLTHVLEKWGYKVVRGSSHIGGNEALIMLLDLIEQNYSVAVTPDGPTGPIHKMKAGAVIVAKRENVPLVLVGIGCNRKIIFKSWDKFEMPLPFSKGSVVYSDPIYIEQNLNYDDTNKKILECEEILNRIQKEAIENC